MALHAAAENVAMPPAPGLKTSAGRSFPLRFESLAGASNMKGREVPPAFHDRVELSAKRKLAASREFLNNEATFGHWVSGVPKIRRPHDAIRGKPGRNLSFA